VNSNQEDKEMSSFLGFLICCIAAIMMFDKGNILLAIIALIFAFISFFTWGLKLRLTKGKDVKKLRRIRARMLLEKKSTEEIQKALKDEISAVEAQTALIPKWVSTMYFAAIAGGIILLLYAGLG
jgi:mannitol-specific phosphotransferase system IIBC component